MKVIARGSDVSPPAAVSKWFTEASHAIPSVLETGTLVETEVFAGVMYGMAWKEHAIT